MNDTMKASKAERVKLHICATFSFVCLVLMFVGTGEYYIRYQQASVPPSEEDVWDGGNIVQAIKQRAQTAAMYYLGFTFSLAIIIIGIGVQSVLVFRQTRDISTALRALLQVELAYQVYLSHVEASKPPQEVEERRNRASHVIRMTNCGVYFHWALMTLMITFITVLQRPLRMTVTARDLNAMWLSISVVFTMLSAMTAANHLGAAEWSLLQTWAVRPTSNTGASLPKTGCVCTVAEILDPEISKRHFLRAVLRGFSCAVSVMAHLFTYVLFTINMKGHVFVIVLAYWVVCTATYFVASRKLLQSMFWGYLSYMMNLAFDRIGYRKPWYVSVSAAVLFSLAGLTCGVLQASMYIFTDKFNTPEYSAGTSHIGHAPLERSIGIGTACLAGFDLALYLMIITVHKLDDETVYEQKVQAGIPNIQVEA